MIVSRFSLIAFAFLFLAAFQLGAVEKRLPMKGEVFAIQDRPAFLILPEKHGGWRAWPATMRRNLKEVLCIDVKCPSCPFESHQRDPHLTRN